MLRFRDSRLISRRHTIANTLRPAVEPLESRRLLSFADGNGAVVTSLTAVPNSRQLVITFDGPLMPGPAEDIANYSVTRALSNPELVSRAGANDPVVLAVYSHTSDSQVTLTLKNPLKTGVFYRVFINGTPASMSVNPDSNPLTDITGEVFDGDNDDTPGGNFYGLFSVGTTYRFADSNGDRIGLAVKGGGALDVWRELDGDIDQLSVVGAAAGASTLTGSFAPAKVSNGSVYVGSITFPVPTPLVLNGATDRLPSSFVTVTRQLTPPPPVPSAASPLPVQATSQNLPYSVSVQPVNTAATALLPGIQSADFAEVAPTAAYPAGLWLVFGGRTNGLHNFTPSGVTNFPPDFQSQDIFVINPANWQTWSMPWSQSGVPVSVYNSLSSADQEYYQQGNTLYAVGGYSVPDTINFTATTTANSPTITVADPDGLAIGQNVSGPGIPSFDQQSNPVVVVITAIAGNTVTLSQPATATASSVGLTASTTNFTTYDTLSTLSVSGMVKAVMTGGSVAALAKIRQISDPRLAVTGGDMSMLGGRLDLVFGQAFQGGYGFNPFSFTQIYTDEIQSFKVVNNRVKLAINWGSYQALRDPINFRRRDGNMVESIQPNGRPMLTYDGGVFSPGDNNTAYQAPILIYPNGRTHVQDNYQQYFSQYTTARATLYNARTRAMNTLFLGGISIYLYSNGQLTEEAPGVPGPAWVDNVTSLLQRRNGTAQEFSFAPLPGNYGAYSKFYLNPRLPAFSNGVIKLARIKRPVVLGYVYGGIFSTVAQTSSNPAVEATQTGASNEVFQVTLSPNSH